jgi:hypothetical protein
MHILVKKQTTTSVPTTVSLSLPLSSNETGILQVVVVPGITQKVFTMQHQISSTVS